MYCSHSQVVAVHKQVAAERIAVDLKFVVDATHSSSLMVELCFLIEVDLLLLSMDFDLFLACLLS